MTHTRPLINHANLAVKDVGRALGRCQINALVAICNQSLLTISKIVRDVLENAHEDIFCKHNELYWLKLEVVIENQFMSMLCRRKVTLNTANNVRFIVRLVRMKINARLATVTLFCIIILALAIAL